MSLRLMLVSIFLRASCSSSCRASRVLRIFDFVLRNPAGAPLGLGVPLRTTPFSSLMTDIISPCFNYLGNRKQMKEAHLFPSQRGRSEEHTSELQSRENLVCRLLLEKNTTIRNA